MNPETEQQVYTLFEAALRCDQEGRAALLDERCGGDAELRAAVERLLDADESASRDRFLAAPASPGAAADPTRPGLWRLCGLNATIRCPHCQNPIELATLPASGEVLCAMCGSTFRLESESTVSGRDTVRGRTLGRFELLATVGAGAFGTVYRAHDPQLDRTVALRRFRIAGS